MSLNLASLPIFPCKIDKSPLTSNGFYNARVGVDYSTWPRVGIATGAVSGIDCIDIDPDGLPWLEANRYRLPLTLEHKTSRGVHLLLIHAEGMRNSNGRIAKGIDVRGDGGYFIDWSREGYPVVDRPLAEWPEWLAALALTAHFDTHALKGRTSRSPCPPSSPEPTANLKLRSSYIIKTVERAQRGERNRLLFWGSCRHGEIIGESKIKREVAEALLIGAAKTNGLWRDDGADAVRATIRSGIETGIRQWKAMMMEHGGRNPYVRPLSVWIETKAKVKAETCKTNWT